MKRILIALVFSLLSVFEAFAKTGAGHRADILDAMFNSSKTETTKELADYISQGIDMGSGAKPSELTGKGSSYLNTMKQNYKEIFDQKLPGLGPHRTLGHWSLDGSIPKDYLKTLVDMERAGKLPPGSRQLFIDNWREFVYTRTEAVKQVYNLSGPNSDRAARSFASMIGDVHNMGDWTTTDCRGLRSLEQVTDDFCRSGNRLLGKNNNLVKALKADLKPVFAKRNNMEVMKAFRKLPQGLTDAQKAEKILEFAKSMPDKEFNEWMMKNLKGLKGEARIKAIMEMPKRFADHKIAGEVLDVVKRYSDDLAGRTGRIFQRMGYDGVMRRIGWEKLKATTKAWKTAKGIGDSLKSGVAADEAVKATSLVKKLKQITANSRVVKLYDSLRVKYNGKIESISQNLAKDAGNTFKNVYTPEALQSLPNVSSSKTVIGALQEVTLKDGSKKLVLSIPIENYASGIRAGLNAGVMTFIFSEGATIYQFARGEITQEDFCWETGKNCSAALLGGSATFVAVALGATPAGWVVMGLGVGTYMICDITFKGLRASIDGPGFKLEDIMGQFPTEFQKRRSAIDFEGVDVIFEYSGNVSILDYHGHDSLFENKSGNPSVFDAEGKNGLFDF